jgi:hypothetical protein
MARHRWPGDTRGPAIITKALKEYDVPAQLIVDVLQRPDLRACSVSKFCESLHEAAGGAGIDTTDWYNRDGSYCAGRSQSVYSPQELQAVKQALATSRLQPHVLTAILYDDDIHIPLEHIRGMVRRGEILLQRVGQKHYLATPEYSEAYRVLRAQRRREPRGVA